MSAWLSNRDAWTTFFDWPERRRSVIDLWNAKLAGKMPQIVEHFGSGSQFVYHFEARVGERRALLELMILNGIVVPNMEAMRAMLEETYKLLGIDEVLNQLRATSAPERDLAWTREPAATCGGGNAVALGFPVASTGSSQVLMATGASTARWECVRNAAVLTLTPVAAPAPPPPQPPPAAVTRTLDTSDTYARTVTFPDDDPDVGPLPGIGVVAAAPAAAAPAAAAAEESDDDDDEDNPNCVKCWERPRVYGFRHLGSDDLHCFLCKQCLDENPSWPTCPSCNKPTEGKALRVFQ